ncbi:hypothetical protein GOB81_13075 [Acetobacter sp. LMG 1627]|uniref:Alginate export domain-containing protein n=2 Tax=Acetobacter conturbans TaxID=1737472 RepID=A0ABX0K1P2_9PROT|nr:hypothetical protein [Acetobacter conturbans]
MGFLLSPADAASKRDEISHKYITKTKITSRDSVRLVPPLKVDANDITARQSGNLRHWGVFNAGNGAASGFGPVAPYGQARWAEDWSFLVRQTPAKRKQDWFNTLKHISLTDDGTIWLSLSGESRLRYIFETQPLLGTAHVTNASRVLLRNQYGADLHMGQHVRVYVQLLNAEAGGSNTYGYQTGLQRERLDLQQGLIEVHGRILGADTGVIAGRQLFLDAPQSMQSVRDLPNVQQTWNGVRGYAIWKRTRLDLFDFAQTNVEPVGIFGNGVNYGGRLFGAYSSTALPKFQFLGKAGQMFVDVFYLGYLYSGANAALPKAAIGQVQAGSTRRDSFGARVWGKAGPLTLNLDGIYQGGTFRPANSGATRPVHAYAANASVTYSETGLWGAPVAGMQADIFSGGNYSKTNGSVGTFGAPYVAAPPYNDSTLSLTSQNLIGVGPIVQAAKGTVHMRIHVPFFWRESTSDAVYGVNKTYSFRNNLHGGFIGVAPQAQIAWSFRRHWTWTHDLEGLALSRGMRQAGAKSGLFYMQTLTFEF